MAWNACIPQTADFYSYRANALHRDESKRNRDGAHRMALCFTHKRSMDTIAEAADFFTKEIITDERLREREKGPDGNNHEMFQKRWADHDYNEDGGESIAMV